MKYTPLFKSWKILFLVAALIFTSFSFKVVAEDKETETLEMSYYFNEPVLSTYRTKDQNYDTVTLPECYCSGKPGEPNIPSKGAYILLPPNSKLSNIQVIAKNKIIIGNNYKIIPISQPIPISKSSPSVKIKENKNIYGNNNFYPGNTYSDVEIYSFKGYDILVLLLHPIQYNPVSGELFYYENLKIKIKTTYHEKES